MRFLRFTDDPARFLAHDGPAFLDGYAFGDRLLEGVAFAIRIEADETGAPQIVASPAPGSADYLADLNVRKWCTEAEAYALETEGFAASEALAGEEIVLFRPDLPHDDQFLPERFTVIEADGSETRYPA